MRLKIPCGASVSVPPICLRYNLTAFLVSVQSAAQASPPPNPIANFTDVAGKAGVTMQEIFGGIDTKKYIIETTGTGVAIFDYDNDGWPDIFLVNGTRLELPPPDQHLAIISIVTITTELSRT